MRIGEIALIVRSLVNEGYRISIKPDLLYLMLPPDILVGGEGNLTAIFVPTKTELKKPTNLLVRLAVSRLALPTHLRCVLFVASDSGSSNVIEKFTSEFHHIQLGDDYSTLRNVMAGDFENTGIGRVSLDVRNQSFARAEFLYSENKQGTLVETVEENDRVVADGVSLRRNQSLVSSGIIEDKHNFSKPNTTSWTERYQAGEKSVTLKGAFKYNDTIIAEINITKKFSERNLNRFWAFGIQSSYALDNGAPYPGNQFQNSLKIMVFNQPLPLALYEADKLFRNAAFAGWWLIEASTPEQFRSNLDRIRKLWKEFLYE